MKLCATIWKSRGEVNKKRVYFFITSLKALYTKKSGGRVLALDRKAILSKKKFHVNKKSASVSRPRISK